MPHLIKCHLCRTEMSMSDDIFARRIAGRKVSLKCRHCTTTLVVDATAANGSVVQGTPRGTPPAATAPMAAAPGAASSSAISAPTPARVAPPRPASVPRMPRVTTAAKPQEAANPTPSRAEESPAAPPPKSPPADAPKPATEPAKSAVEPAKAAVEPVKPLKGLPITPVHAAASPLRHATPRVRTPPPFPAVSAAATLDDAQEVSVVELLPTEPPPAPATKTVPAPANDAHDDVQEVSVVDLLPPGPPPLAARLPAPASLVDTPPPAPVASPVTAPEPSIEPERPPVAPAAEASPFAQTVAYSPEIDLTPRAFAIQEPPAQSDVANDVASAPPRRASAWRTKAAVAAVAFLGVAAAAVVVRSGVLRSAATSPDAAKRVEHDRAAPAAAPQVTPREAAVTDQAAHAAPRTAPAAAAALVEPPASPTPVEAAATTTPATTAAATASAASLPPYVSEPGVRFLTRVAVQRAERTCHRRGRAVGKARVFVTFARNGRAIEARVQGEPIESAPVSRCIKDQLYAVVIPKFDGASFTVSEPITLY